MKQVGRANLVDRHFASLRTDQFWVADFTYVWTLTWWVYVVFAFDAHSRRVLGSRAAAPMATHWCWTALRWRHSPVARKGRPGSLGTRTIRMPARVYASIAFTERLVDESVGRRRHLG